MQRKRRRKKPHAIALGRLGGLVCSKAKRRAYRASGYKGGLVKSCKKRLAARRNARRPPASGAAQAVIEDEIASIRARALAPEAIGWDDHGIRFARDLEAARCGCVHSLIGFLSGKSGSGLSTVAGADEVGVGAFAGPVIAAAVVLPPDTAIGGLADSKLLGAKYRAELFGAISRHALMIGIGRAEMEEVDQLNVFWAAMEARRRAVEVLPIRPSHVLVDGRRARSPVAACRRPRWWMEMEMRSAHPLPPRRSWPG